MIAERAVAREAAAAAALILRDARPARVDHKGVVDLVTDVDLRCEAAVRAVLLRHLPDVPVHGEEEGGAPDARTRWLVDPLDGTTNFVHGFPWFAVSVGLQVDGESVVGVVADPLRGLFYEASRGGGAWCGDRPMRVSALDDLGDALVGTGFPPDRRERAALYLRRVEAVLTRCTCVRRTGSAALDLAMVADGALDAFWEFGLAPWDVCAGEVLVTEAGGRVTDHFGGALSRAPVSPLATNGRLHEGMRELLARVSDP